MSLYNMLHGYNNNALVALSMLGLSEAECGRFRDAWIEEDGKHIVVFTRNGGGNRDDYQPVIDELAEHPNYVTDYDDDFDSTYASIKFTVPERYLELADKLKPKEHVPSLWEKTQGALRGIEQSVIKQKEKEGEELIKKFKDSLAEVMKVEREEKR